MSWETSTEGTREEIVLRDIPFPEADREVQEEVQEQYNVALIAAKNLLRYTGQPEDIVNVHLSGHANPDHLPADEYGPESIVVHVAVVGEDIEEAPEEITRKETPKKEASKKETKKETETSEKKSPKKETDSE